MNDADHRSAPEATVVGDGGKGGREERDAARPEDLQRNATVSLTILVRNSYRSVIATDEHV